MTATRSHIEIWINYAKEKGASHLIVAVDTYDNDNYPVYVGHDEDIHKEIAKVNDQSMHGIDEVYNMSMDIDEQLSAYRAYNI